MASIHWRVPTLIAAICLVAYACASESTPNTDQADERAARTEAVESSISPTTSPPEVTEWSNNDLPVPFSPLVPVAGNVVYRTVDDGQLTLVAVSAAAGTEVWRQPIDPLGQLRGIAPAPLVFEDVAIVVSPQFVNSREVLTAFDATSGDVLWSEDVNFAALPAFHCGNGVCAHYEQDRVKYDVVTGMRSPSKAPHVDTIFKSNSSYLFASGPRPTRNTEWVALHDSGSGEQQWKVDRADIEAEANLTVSPEYGWSAMIVEEANIVALFLGTDAPDVAGLWSGLDLDTGAIRWTYVDQQACIFDDFAPDKIVVCTSDDKEQTIGLLSFATGEAEWSQVIGGAEDFVWTAALDSYVFAEGPGEPATFDIDSGAELDRSTVELCGFSQPWQPLDVDWWNEPVSYRAASIPALCDGELATVSAADAVRLDPALAEAAHVAVGNGWSVAVGVDGELSGVYVE